jgi:hypothetical protein
MRLHTHLCATMSAGLSSDEGAASSPCHHVTPTAVDHADAHTTTNVTAARQPVCLSVHCCCCCCCCCCCILLLVAVTFRHQFQVNHNGSVCSTWHAHQAFMRILTYINRVHHAATVLVLLWSWAQLTCQPDGTAVSTVLSILLCCGS